jgi:circadian clock protein KaiC
MPRRSSLPKTPVGIDGFDLISAGGIPTSRSTLVVGTSGAGKTVFALQFLAQGLAKFDEGGVLVTFEERPEDLLLHAKSFGWELEEAVEDGRLVIVDASPRAEEEIAEVGDYDLSGLLAQIKYAAEKTGSNRVVLDSLAALFIQFGNEQVVRREMKRIIVALRGAGLTTVITSERTEEYGQVARFGVEEFIADNVIIMRNSLENEKRRRTIEILKFRGASHDKGEYPFSIAGRSGISVIPLSAIELGQAVTDERISSGVAELDEMCGGGYFRDSLTLVSGATGTGKSLLAASFAQAGLEADERCLMFSFEESENQVVRNAGSWGFDLEKAREEGCLRIHSQYPERMALEDLLIEIKSELEEFKPRRVAIDSVSALERTSSTKAFREFISGLSSFLKSTQTAGLFIHTSTKLMGDDVVTEAHVSTMSDAIVMLRYFQVGGELRRCVNVLKLRGSNHSPEIREFTIGDNGMEIRGQLPDVDQVLGQSYD